MTDVPPKGWGFPAASRKAHYFAGLTSLCGKWMFTGALEDTRHEHKDNCAQCKRLRAKRENAHE